MCGYEESYKPKPLGHDEFVDIDSMLMEV